MPEKGDKYFHIPVRNKKLFDQDTLRTINVTSGVLVVIGKPKGSDTTKIQKFMLLEKKFKIKESAIKWVREQMNIKSERITDKIELKRMYGGKMLSWGAVFKSFNKDDQTVTIEASDDSIDVYDDRVMIEAQADIVKGVKDGFTTIFIDHDWWHGIGVVRNVWNEGNSTFMKIYISSTESKIWTKIEEGILKGASIAFIPTDVKEDVWYEEEQMMVREIYGLKYFETSLTYIPANMNAGVRTIGD